MSVSNPTSEVSARFDPKTDDDNARAHGEDEKDKRPERDDDIQTVVRQSIERALNHYEENLQPEQTKATDYYHGRPFGDEQDGRSKVVSTDVRDATHAQMPSLLRVFFGPERAVEFRPRGPEDEALAAQITDYINYLIAEENPGLLTFDSWFKDALVRKLGWVKWWWEEYSRVEATTYTGLGPEELFLLLNDPDHRGVENVESVQTEAGVMYNARVRRQKSDGCVKFACIPPEEVVYTPNARCLEDAPLVAHVREVPREDLVLLGIPDDLIDEHAGKSRSRQSDELKDARQVNNIWDDEAEEPLDKSQKPVLFAEAFCLIDTDGDGVAELRKFHCVGPQFEIANGDGELVDEVPFASLTPHPEPHTIPGLGNYDLLKDIQRIKSQIQRGTLDSLALALEQKTEVVEGEVNVQDLISPEIHGIVRVRKSGMMREITHTFLGKDTLPVLGYWDEIREGRTGHTKAAAGLDADSLQSSTKAAVAATLSASQQRLEYIARIFAETGVKRLFKGLLGLVVKHQNREKVVRLRGQYVAVDPRHWDATMDVSVNVGLGQGAPEDRVQTLAGILGVQRELMQMGSPLVTNVELRATLAKTVEVAGWRNADTFFRPWGPQDEAQLQQAMASQPPPPDANLLLVEVEAMKAQMTAQRDAAKLEIEREKIRLEDDRERDRIAREMALKEHEIELKHQADIEDMKLKAKIQADRDAMAKQEKAA